ncbi:MAG: hypothetical protein HUK14_12725 [Muribaculaceae bacterium]|nr:hypothetical protein [Muribaculaceae bacterium]
MELITELVNKIKKSIRLVILIFGLVGVCNSSCSKNDGINDGILDYYYSREASYKIEPDTLYVSSSPYDCTVWVTNKFDVKDTISVWDYIQVDEYAWNDQTSPMHDRWHLYSNGGDTSSNCTSFTRYDWLEFTIVEKCGKKGIRIKASENDTDHMRGARLYVCKEEDRTTHVGEFFFFQYQK